MIVPNLKLFIIKYAEYADIIWGILLLIWIILTAAPLLRCDCECGKGSSYSTKNECKNWTSRDGLYATVILFYICFFTLNNIYIYWKLHMLRLFAALISNTVTIAMITASSSVTFVKCGHVTEPIECTPIIQPLVGSLYFIVSSVVIIYVSKMIESDASNGPNIKADASNGPNIKTDASNGQMKQENMNNQEHNQLTSAQSSLDCIKLIAIITCVCSFLAIMVLLLLLEVGKGDAQSPENIISIILIILFVVSAGYLVYDWWKRKQSSTQSSAQSSAHSSFNGAKLVAIVACVCSLILIIPLSIFVIINVAFFVALAVFVVSTGYLVYDLKENQSSTKLSDCAKLIAIFICVCSLLAIIILLVSEAGKGEVKKTKNISFIIFMILFVVSAGYLVYDWWKRKQLQNPNTQNEKTEEI